MSRQSTRPIAPPRALLPEPPPVQAPIGARSEADMNLRIVQPLLRYVQERHGAAAVAALGEAAGLEANVLGEGQAWVSHTCIEAVLAGASELIGDERELERAFGHRVVEGYGALGWVLRALSVGRAYDIMSRTLHFVSRVSQFEISDQERNGCRLRYTTSKPESALMCLSRRVAIREVPVLWSRAPAQIVEEACVARGDDACVYRLRWQDGVRVWPAGLLATIGGVGGGALLAAGLVDPVSVGLLSVLGAAAGLGQELWLTARTNARLVEEGRRALEQLAAENVQATDDLLALHQRQAEWVSLLERRAVDRQEALDQLLASSSAQRASRSTALRELSHDLRNPLMVARVTIEHLRGLTSDDADEAVTAIEELEVAVQQVEGMLRALSKLADDDRAQAVRKTHRVEVAPMADRLRGTLTALTRKRDIRVTVFSTREAPASIETDEVAFDRVVDNIATNAAKYTDRGSIITEIGGTPGFLCIKVSDTGRGISQEILDAGLVARAANPSPAIGDSQGVGLAGAVRLLDALGGRMEVMSRPGLGTTVWLFFPLSPPSISTGATVESIDSVVRRAVRIRKVVA